MGWVCHGGGYATRLILYTHEHVAASRWWTTACASRRRRGKIPKCKFQIPNEHQIRRLRIQNAWDPPHLLMDPMIPRQPTRFGHWNLGFVW